MGTRIIRRAKNRIKILILLVLIISLLMGIILGGLYYYYYYQKNAVKVVNFSIDDATSIFQDITLEQYNSIFDNSILAKVKDLHDKYNITVTLYVFEQLDEFSIWEMPADYKEEFRKNADWLKIGFHSPTEENPVGIYTQMEYEFEYARTESAICKFAGGDSVAHVLRLHYWSATDEIVTYLKTQGVTGLLCRDSEEKSYNLTDEQTLKLYESRNGLYKINELTYYVTDIRIESTENILEQLEERKKDRVIIMFTHAWCFEDNYNKLKEAVIYLSDNGYQFSTLEGTAE